VGIAASLARMIAARIATGAGVVVGVVALAWLTLFVLRPNVIDDGTPVLRQLTGHLERAFLHFDLGTAKVPGSPTVASRIRAGLPADLALLAGGLVTGTAPGVAGCALAALRPRSAAARAAEAVAVLVVTMNLVVDAVAWALDPALRRSA
jgi:ABC-type dipeptide/oligopeptide/nickel transport system permease component